MASSFSVLIQPWTDGNSAVMKMRSTKHTLKPQNIEIGKAASDSFNNPCFLCSTTDHRRNFVRSSSFITHRSCSSFWSDHSPRSTASGCFPPRTCNRPCRRRHLSSPQPTSTSNGRSSGHRSTKGSSSPAASSRNPASALHLDSDRWLRARPLLLLPLHHVVATIAIPIMIWSIIDEEKLLVRQYGEEYQQYMKQVPWRIIPHLF